MEFDKKQYIESQRHGWDSVAPAWEKWDKSLDMNMSFVNHKLIGDACIRDGHKVLDLGCGTGYPAILAAQTVGNNGSVIGLDLSEEMLKVAKRKAGELDIANIQFQSRDITTLPFEPASFDAVISRFCIMFLPDIQGAVNEIARVLKQGGYFSAAVWSAPNKNPFIKIPMDVLKKFIDIPTPPPGQPGLFRLSRHGDLLGMATASGLSGIADEEITGESNYDSPEEYFTSLKEMAAPLKPLFAKLTPEQKDEAENEINRTASEYQKGDKIALPMAFRIVTSQKP